MFSTVLTRFVVQKPNHDKYYFHVVNATTDHSYPFSIPVASVEVIANSGTFDYITTLAFDDIVRLQVSVQYSASQKVVWVDIFEGRIVGIKAAFGVTNTATISCVGHVVETRYAIINETANYPTPTVLSGIINYFAGIYLTRTTVAFPNGAPPVSVPYTTKLAQKYMKDMMADMEELTGYTWFFEADPVYDSDGNLISCPINFKPFATTATNKYKAIQGTPRLISADFNSDGNNVYTSMIQFGKTPAAVAPATEGVQYKGTYTDSAKVALYGLRTKVNTDTGLTSDALCTSFAQYALPKISSPYISGTLKLEGTFRAHIGDLVTVKIPGIDLYGTPIDGTFTVIKVHHSISDNDFTTTLSVGGSVDMDMEDYIIEFAKQNRLNLQNFVS